MDVYARWILFPDIVRTKLCENSVEMLCFVGENWGTKVFCCSEDGCNSAPKVRADSLPLTVVATLVMATVNMAANWTTGTGYTSTTLVLNALSLLSQKVALRLLVSVYLFSLVFLTFYNRIWMNKNTEVINKSLIYKNHNDEFLF